ncbi:pseudouridine synthase [Hellea balneolensis]|uniref:pseudouridine synthase n=1 Tax=Hellea balneolensis TaxID=287478 RepID=UPI000412E514|nr:pseudouridine synthase [Hellea balneolensis]
MEFNPNGERIAKFLARSGVASRRESEKLIEAGRIKVNGKTLTTPAFKVTEKDVVLFDNNPIADKEPPRLWRYHKPDGLVTSHKDEKGRETVFDSLPEEMGRVISIGRLDITSEGLLLLTNDGELARQLELPSTAWQRKYRVRAYGHVTQADLDGLKAGIKIDGILTGPIEAELERQKGDNVWIAVILREGKNREVRRALDTLGLHVNRLIRVSYGPFQLGNLDKGEVEEVKARVLRQQVGHLIDVPEPLARPQGQRVSKPKRGTHASAKRFAKDGKKDDGKPAPTGRGKFAHKPAKKNKSGGSGYGGGSSGGRKMNFKGSAKGKPTANKPAGRRK